MITLTCKQPSTSSKKLQQQQQHAAVTAFFSSAKSSSNNVQPPGTPRRRTCSFSFTGPDHLHAAARSPAPPVKQLHAAATLPALSSPASLHAAAAQDQRQEEQQPIQQQQQKAPFPTSFPCLHSHEALPRRLADHPLFSQVCRRIPISPCRQRHLMPC